jgi:hypothetical protein
MKGWFHFHGFTLSTPRIDIVQYEYSVGNVHRTSHYTISTTVQVAVQDVGCTITTYRRCRGI